MTFTAQPQAVTMSAFDPATHNARLRQHMNEYTKCVVWCIEAGPDFHPAFEHKHLAPSDARNFYFEQRPWLVDGTVNSAGVPPAPFDFDKY